MYRYLMDHEDRILYLMRSGNIQDWNIFRDYHRTQIGFMQHERLIHLIVTIAFTFLMLIAYAVTVLFTLWATVLLDIALTALVVFCIYHYYRLENGVQRWYGIYDQICRKGGGISTGQPETPPERHTEIQPESLPERYTEMQSECPPERNIEIQPD